MKKLTHKNTNKERKKETHKQTNINNGKKTKWDIGRLYIEFHEKTSLRSLLYLLCLIAR
jgi:hypothetical protein